MPISGNYECMFVDTGLLFSNTVLNAVFNPEFSEPAGNLSGKNKQLQVLLADNDEDDRMFFANAISSVTPSASLITVHNGDDLISFLQKTRDSLPDLVFMDINMPRKNGLECLREIKSNVQLRHLPILIYSTSVNSDHIDETYNYGASLYIQKPASYDGITRILKNIFALSPYEWRFQPNREKFVIQQEKGTQF